MLDINFIRENQALVEKSIREKGYQTDLSKLLELDQQRRKLLQEVDKLRRDRNEISAQMKNGKPDSDLIVKAKEIKAQLVKQEPSLDAIEKELNDGLKQVPNIIFDDVPLGGEESNLEIRKWGELKAEGVDHLDYATKRNWVDFERGAKVAGSKFYYLKGELALLEQALIQYGIQKVMDHGFEFITVPDVVSTRILEGCGFNPRSSAQSDEYFVEGEDLALIATAEMPLTGYYMDEILNEKDLPVRFAGLSPCFRKEAGTYGKYTRGLFRVHQFNKLEMYVFCLPEESKKIHEQILEIEEEIAQDLELPYHIVSNAAGDLGAPAAKKYDLEFWSPISQKYRELTSCSNCTDFQARSLNIRVRREDGRVETLHTLNGTAIPLARTLMALIENHAEPDGKLKLPLVLRKYFNEENEL